MDIKNVSKKTYKTDFRIVYPTIMGIKKKAMNYQEGRDESIKADFYQWIRSIFNKSLYERTGEYPWENKPLPEAPKIQEQPKEPTIQERIPFNYSLSELNYPMERYPTYIGPTESELEQMSRSRSQNR